MRILLFLMGLGISFGAMATPGDLKIYGKDAPMQMYLFTSFTCPHCATFHKQVFPAVKKEYVDTGKVQLTVVDLIGSQNALLATTIVRCVDGKNADNLEDELYENQHKWMHKDLPDAQKTIKSYAKRHGITEDQLKLCLEDKKMQQEMWDRRRNLANLYHATSTPSLILRKGSRVHVWKGGDKKEIMENLKEAFEDE